METNAPSTAMSGNARASQANGLTFLTPPRTLLPPSAWPLRSQCATASFPGRALLYLLSLGGAPPGRSLTGPPHCQPVDLRIIRQALCCVSGDAQRVAEPGVDPRAVIESALYVEALLAPVPARERDVMRLLSNGVGPTEIAAVLGLHKERKGICAWQS